MLPAELSQKYEVLRTLGAGAMGTVVEAMDRNIRRRVAIKVIKLAREGDPEGKNANERFRREAQAAGNLTHANIVIVHDYGENSEAAWIVMELVEGGSLKDRIDGKERFAVADAARIMEQVLSALAYSHQREVVHRDIKPANIMLTSKGLDATVKIADFGIARIENSSLTQTGMVIGTPAYMAPEQFRGEPVDARADLWAAGVVLYQLLTGERPFEGGFTAVMHKALNSEAVPPSQLSMMVARPFDDVIARALAKRPEDRFQTAAEFSLAIRAALTAPLSRQRELAAASDGEATLVAPPRTPDAVAGLPGIGPSGSGLHARPPTGGAGDAGRQVPGAARSRLPLIVGGAGLLAALLVAGWFVISPGGSTPEELARQLEQARAAELSGEQETSRIVAEAARQADIGRRQEAERRADASRLERLRQAELARLSDTARQRRLTEQERARQEELFGEQVQALRTEAARQAEVARQAAEAAGRAELARQASEAARIAQIARQRDIVRGQGNAVREAELARRHAEAQQTEQARQQQAAREAEAARQAEAARAQDDERRAAELPRQQEAERRRQDDWERERQNAIARVNFQDAAAAAVRAVSCGLLTWTVGDQSLTISGVLRRGDETTIRRVLAERNVPEHAARLSFQTFDGPYCGAFDLFRPVAALGDSAPRVSVVGATPLLAGQLLRLEVQLPQWPAHLHVAYLMSSGEVVNLVPSQYQQANARVRLGEPRGNFAGWEVDEPFGTDLAIVIVSDQPLFPAARPLTERQDAYLAALATALRNARLMGNRVILRPMVVETARAR